MLTFIGALLFIAIFIGNFNDRARILTRFCLIVLFLIFGFVMFTVGYGVKEHDMFEALPTCKPSLADCLKDATLCH